MNGEQQTKLQVKEPFYSQAFQGWRIEASDGQGWSDSIVVYGEADAWFVYNLGTKDWYEAKRRERAINIERQRAYDAEVERKRQEQRDKPR